MRLWPRTYPPRPNRVVRLALGSCEIRKARAARLCDRGKLCKRRGCTASRTVALAKVRVERARPGSEVSPALHVEHLIGVQFVAPGYHN